jgi:hypothetical protein
MLIVVAGTHAFAGGLVAPRLAVTEPLLAQAPQTDTAERFRLVDSSGRSRAELFTYGSGAGTTFLLACRRGAKALGCGEMFTAATVG